MCDVIMKKHDEIFFFDARVSLSISIMMINSVFQSLPKKVINIFMGW